MDDSKAQRSAAFREAFEKMHSQGVAFPSLVLDMLKHHGHSVATLSLVATQKQGRAVSEHQIRSSLHGRVAATDALREALEETIGFDPWSVVGRPNLPTVRRDLERLCNSVAHTTVDDPD